MFPTYISNGVMTQEEVDNFTARCANTKNIEIDTKKDYIDTIISSDLLVADYTSLIAEFFITGKPVIFCDTVAGLNDEGQKICGSLYFADTFADVVRQIEHVRDKDEDIDKRRALIKELLPDKVGNIGRNILDAIINS
jgi:CDP-glycerol glycerophosphotransferase (TagB/SpsB family)